MTRVTAAAARRRDDVRCRVAKTRHPCTVLWQRHYLRIWIGDQVAGVVTDKRLSLHIGRLSKGVWLSFHAIGRQVGGIQTCLFPTPVCCSHINILKAFAECATACEAVPHLCGRQVDNARRRPLCATPPPSPLAVVRPPGSPPTRAPMQRASAGEAVRDGRYAAVGQSTTTTTGPGVTGSMTCSCSNQ